MSWLSLSRALAPVKGVRRIRRGELSIRSRLAALVCVCVLPVWGAAGFLISYAYEGKRALVESQMLETARALSLTVDQKLLAIQSSLRVLATSPHLTAGDLAGLHAQAREVLKDYPEADIVMADSGGQQVINTYRNFGEPLPRRGVSEAVRRVFESGKPVITDLFRGAVTRRALIGIDVPVFVKGKVVYDLAMTLPAERLTDILLQQHLAAGWLGVILDSQGVVVARTLNPE
ncbi:MAG: cache domain-containing protein, partial [Rhodospirillaceae bacterium]